MGNFTRLVLCALAASTAFATEAEKLCADAKTQREDNDVATLNDEGPRWYGPVVKDNTTRLEKAMKGCCQTKPFTVKMDTLASKWKNAVSDDIECFWRCDLAEEWPEDNEERKDLINDSYDCFMMKSPWEVEFASKPKFLPPDMITPPPPGGQTEEEALEDAKERAGMPTDKDEGKGDDEKDEDEDEKEGAGQDSDNKDGERKGEAGEEQKKAGNKGDEDDKEEQEEKKEDDDSGAVVNEPTMALAAVVMVGLAMFY